MARLPPTFARVERNTSPSATRHIQATTRARVKRALEEGRLAHEIDRLNAEWDTERIWETNAACLLLLSLGLGAYWDRRWLWLTGGVAAFLLQHAAPSLTGRF